MRAIVNCYTGIGEIYTVKQNEHTHVENIGVHDT